MPDTVDRYNTNVSQNQKTISGGVESREKLSYGLIPEMVVGSYSSEDGFLSFSFRYPVTEEVGDTVVAGDGDVIIQLGKYTDKVATVAMRLSSGRNVEKLLKIARDQLWGLSEKKENKPLQKNLRIAFHFFQRNDDQIKHDIRELKNNSS